MAKILVLYYSMYGHIETMAHASANGQACVIRRRKLPKPFLKSLTMTRNWQKKYGKKVAMRC